MEVKLVMQAGEDPGRVIPIEADEFVIGRDPSCQLQLSTERVSHRHCRILKRGGRVVVEDLHSTNGTAVNDRVVGVVELSDGDRLRVGPASFRVSIPAGAAGPKGRTGDWIAGAQEAGAQSRPLTNLLGSNTDTPAVAAARPAASRRGRLLVTREQGITLAQVVDHTLVQDPDIRAFDDELGTLIAEGRDRFVLDLSNVEFISSTAIGRILKYQRRCQNAGGLIKVCKLRPDVAKVFAIMNLQRVVSVYPDEASALQSEWPPPAPSWTAAAAVVPAPRSPGGGAPPEAGGAVPPNTPSQALPGRVRLIVEAGRSKGQAVEVKVPLFTIGRDPACQLRPNSPTISRHHALIEQRDGRVFVRDLGGKNGTWINDRKLQGAEAEVVDGNRFQVGPLQFFFAISDRGDPGGSRLDVVAASWMLPEGATSGEGSTTLLQKVPAADSASAPAPPPSSPPSPSVAGLQHLACEVVRDVLVIAIRTPDLDDETTVAPVRHELLVVLEQMTPRRVVLRFDAVRFLSSRAAGMLLAFYQRLHRAGGVMRLCHISPDVMRHLEHMRVPMLIGVAATLEEAIQSTWE